MKSCIDMYINGNFADGITGPGIFDGFDIDWEFPSSPSDRANLTKLMAEFRKQLDAVRPGLTLTLVAPPGSWAFNFIDLAKVQTYVDYFNVETMTTTAPGKTRPVLWHRCTAPSGTPMDRTTRTPPFKLICAAASIAEGNVRRPFLWLCLDGFARQAPRPVSARYAGGPGGQLQLHPDHCWWIHKIS